MQCIIDTVEGLRRWRTCEDGTYWHCGRLATMNAVRYWHCGGLATWGRWMQCVLTLWRACDRMQCVIDTVDGLRRGGLARRWMKCVLTLSCVAFLCSNREMSVCILAVLACFPVFSLLSSTSAPKLDIFIWIFLELDQKLDIFNWIILNVGSKTG